MRKQKISIIYKIILILVCAISIIATTGILDGKRFDISAFAWYTTLSNLFVLVYYILDIIHLLKGHKRDYNPRLKHSALLAISLTLIVAHFVLKLGLSFNTLAQASWLGLHYIVPIMTIIDWILFEKKGYTSYNDPLYWIIFPLLYAIFVLINGKLELVSFGYLRYPYPFINVDMYGYPIVLTNILTIAICYIVASYIFIYIDGKLEELFTK